MYYLLFDIINLVLVLTVLSLIIYTLYKVSKIKSDTRIAIDAMHKNLLTVINEINHVNKTEYEVDARQEADILALKGHQH